MIKRKEMSQLKNNNFEPDYAIPPMETLKEVLEDRMVTLSVLSRMTGLDYEVILEVMEVRRQIDETIAGKLGEALDIPKTFWLNLEKNYQEALIRLKEDKK